MSFNETSAQQIHRHVVIWLDEHIGIMGNNEAMKARFRRITDPLHTFTNVHETVAFMREQQEAGRSVFLIVSGKLAHDILPIIYPLACLVYVFIFCRDMKQHMELATRYIDKVLMHDSDEELLIQLTNEIAAQLARDAERYEQENNILWAAGLYDWADWLYNDADTLRHAVCQRFRQIIQEKRQRLASRVGGNLPNQFQF